MTTGFSIGKVATAAGVSVPSVRYYERLALLPPARRTESGYRIYAEDTVERLRFIRQAQALGFRLDEIKEIMRLRFAGQSPCDCVQKMLGQKLREVEREMTRLQKFRRVLRKTLVRANQLPRLPHKASTLCPIIQSIPTGSENPDGKEKPRSKS